jgi:membrane fusion protein, multidrug efflux system
MQDRPISVVFTLAEAQLPRIQQAMTKATLPVLANSGDDKLRLAAGQLLTPNNAIDTTTGTIHLKATFANDDTTLWPGEFVNVRLRVDTLQHGVTIPLGAIKHGPNGLYVFTIKLNNTAQKQAVHVSYQDGNSAVISQGLSGSRWAWSCHQCCYANLAHITSAVACTLACRTNAVSAPLHMQRGNSPHYPR